MPAGQQYFEILGLDAPPSDRKAVKRAYSKQLKVTRPEDDPEGFMRLRDAHDIALNIVARQAEQAAWKTEPEPEIAPISDAAPVSEPSGEALTEPSLTYEDMLPAQAESAPEEDTSYSIGPTPIMDAPAMHFEPEALKAPPLLEDIDALLSSPQNYNDRESWNRLFRNARQLDIDDYVEFENLLMETILRFHGYFDSHENYDTPEKMPQKFSPSITASLFKTMSWDQVSTQGYHRGHQIDWLSRRMHIHKQGANPVPVPKADDKGAGHVWLWIIGVFILLKIIQALANA